MRIVEKCPVCGSKDIRWETKQISYKHAKLKVGSYCNNCGVRFTLEEKK